MELSDRHVVITGAAGAIGRALAFRIAAERPLRAAGILAPEEVAESVVAGIRDESFLILPHPRVAQRLAFKGSDSEGWVRRIRSFMRDVRSGDEARKIGAT